MGMRAGMMMAMSTQIAVRLPEELVEMVDRLVAEGRAPSRAAVVTSALERELRRVMDEKDAETLRRIGPEDDLDDLVNWTANHLDVDD